MLADYEAKLAAKQAELEGVLADVADERTKLALQYKYVDGMTWFKIADRIGDDLTGDGVRMMCQRYLKNNF